MTAQIAGIVGDWRNDFTFERCGIGFGGPVIFAEQRIAQSTHAGGWSDFDLPALIEPVIGVRPIMDNDANVAALGEAVHGAGRGNNPIFYVTLGSGVGGGLVLDGKIYHGAIPGEAEIGHVRLDRDGTTVESRCSGWASIPCRCARRCSPRT